LGIGATYPNAFGAPIFPYGLLRLTAACTYASPVEYEFRAEIKISRFWSFASITPIINGGGKGYTAETESLLSSLALE